MKRFDYNSVKERLNDRLSPQVKLPEKYEFLDSIEGLGELHTCVDEYIVRVDKSELIKK